MSDNMQVRGTTGEPVDEADMFDWSDRQEGIKKLAELIKGINIAMLTTIDEDGSLRSRPMGTQQVEFDGDLWFFTDDDSAKANEIAREQQVNVTYADGGKALYISVSGLGFIVHDRAKMEALWSPVLKVWFEQGLDTPNIALLRVVAEKAEYWDGGSKIASALNLVKSLVTGKRDEGNDHAKLEL